MKKMILLAFIFVGAFAGISAQASETTKGLQKDYDKFKQEMTVKLDETEKQIDSLRAKAQTQGAEAKDKTVAELEKARTDLQTQLADTKADSKKSWKSFKKSFAQSVDGLNTKIQSYLNK